MKSLKEEIKKHKWDIILWGFAIRISVIAGIILYGKPCWEKHHQTVETHNTIAKFYKRPYRHYNYQRNEK